MERLVNKKKPFPYCRIKSTFTRETLMTVAHVANTDFKYALIRVFTCETQVAATVGVVRHRKYVALSQQWRTWSSAIFFFCYPCVETLIKHFNKLAHAHD